MVLSQGKIFGKIEYGGIKNYNTMKKSKIIITLSFLVIILLGCSRSKLDAHEPNTGKRAVDKGVHIVGYIFSNRNLDAESDKLDFTKFTHLNVAFINPNEDGTFAPVTGLRETVKRAHDQGVKVFSSFAGGNPPQYLKTLLRDENRVNLVSALVNLTKTYNLDGIDVDLEGDFIDENYEDFVVELHTALKKENKQITAAVATWNGQLITNRLLELYDLIHIMSYDQTGPWRKDNPGPHSTYEASVSDLTYWNETRKVPLSKLTLGLPFYGYGFGPNISEDMTFDQIVNTYPASENVDLIVVPGKGTMYYNGIPTIQKKVKLVLDKKVGGVMIWHLLGDAKGDKSLLSTINNKIP